MQNLLYEELPPLSHVEAESNLASGDAGLVARTLISVGMNDDDGKWVQTQALPFLSHDDEAVVSAAILALAHTARVNRAIDEDKVMPALAATAASFPQLAGRVQDALDDIEIYVLRHKRVDGIDS